MLLLPGKTSADLASDLDAQARKAAKRVVATVQSAAAQSRTFAEASTSIQSFAQSRQQAERGRAPATAGLKEAQAAAKEEARYRKSGGKNEQALKSALSSYDRAIAAATQLTQLEATLTACHKGMEMMLPRVESSAQKIRADIEELERAVASLDQTVRSMKAKKVQPDLITHWERQLAKAKSDREQIAALGPVVEKRVREMRKLGAIPPSPAAARKKIADAEARHARALAKLEGLEAKRAILAAKQEQGRARIGHAGMTLDHCDVRRVDWKNFQYVEGRGGALQDGQAHWESEYEAHDLSLRDVAYGDLDGDSEEEAYVWITDWLDWADVGASGGENLYVFTVDATCRLVRIGDGYYPQDVQPGKIVGNRYVVIDEMNEERVEWSFKDGKLRSIKKPIEN